MLLAGSPLRIRSVATRIFSLISSRPASSGGCVPAPGAYGLEIGSAADVISKLGELQNIYKLAKLHQIPQDDFHAVAGCYERIRFLREREPVYPAYSRSLMTPG
jgi:hypothetical protein